MKKCIFALILTSLCVIAFLCPQIVKASETGQISPKNGISEWIQKLANCESSDNNLAYNPNDLDNTPSIGRFQFKTTTFKSLAIAYKIVNPDNLDEYDWQNIIWDGIIQEKIVRRMIADKSINLKVQFPSCVRKLGLPPKI